MPDLTEQPRCQWPADGHTPTTGPETYDICGAVVFADNGGEYHRASSGPGIVLRVPFVCPAHETYARRAGWKIVLWNMHTNRVRAWEAKLPPEPPDARATAENPISLRAGHLGAEHLGWVIRLEPHPPHQLIGIQHRRDRGPGSAVTALFYENAPADVVGANRLVEVWPPPPEPDTPGDGNPLVVHFTRDGVFRTAEMVPVPRYYWDHRPLPVGQAPYAVQGSDRGPRHPADLPLYRFADQED